MSNIPAADDVLDPDEAVYDLPTVASILGVPVTKVHQHLRQKHLIGVRRNGVLVVPQIFFDVDGHVVKSLSGLLVVLHDGGFGETEIVRWLFTPGRLAVHQPGRGRRRATQRAARGRAAFASGA